MSDLQRACIASLIRDPAANYPEIKFRLAAIGVSITVRDLESGTRGVLSTGDRWLVRTSDVRDVDAMARELLAALTENGEFGPDAQIVEISHESGPLRQKTLVFQNERRAS